MNNLEKDIKYVDSILNKQCSDIFGFIYSRTNENLVKLFKEIDLTNKNVYTVMSSSDILFSALTNGAKKVDCFDINPITYRYFHLRKWILNWKYIDADGLSISELLYIVNHAICISQDEQYSQIFWQYFLSKIDNIHFYSNILFEYIEKPDVPYKTKIAELREILNNLIIKYNNIDIGNKLIDIKETYDIIFLTNILDYNRNNTKKLNIICENLWNLLNNNGSIICSQIPQHSELLNKEKILFQNYFNYEELFIDKKESQKILYYKYTKK